MESIMSSNNHDSIAVPKTITPWGKVLLGNGLVLLAILLVALIILLPIWGRDPQSPVVALVVTMIACGLLISNGGFAHDTPDWQGVLVFDPLSKRRRVMFPGINPKLIWEQIDGNMTDLRRELSTTNNQGDEIEKFPTNDPAEVMEVPLTIYFRLTTEGTPVEAADNFIRFHSIEDHALQVIVRKEIVKMFGKYYAKHEMEELLDANTIQQAVLEDTDNAHFIETKLEQAYGIHVGVILGPSRPDEATKAMKRTPARAESLRDARLTLMTPHLHANRDGTFTTIEAMSAEEATRATLLLDDNTDYTERHNTFAFKIDAQGIENVRDINIMPTGLFGGKEDDGKGKGKK